MIRGEPYLFSPDLSLRFQEEGMTHRTHAVAKTRAHQVRWSSRCRSRTAGAGARAAAGARGAAAAGRGRTTQLRLSSASTLVDDSPQLQRSSHALLRPQESKWNAVERTIDDTQMHRHETAMVPLGNPPPRGPQPIFSRKNLSPFPRERIAYLNIIDRLETPQRSSKLTQRKYGQDTLSLGTLCR